MAILIPRTKPRIQSTRWDEPPSTYCWLSQQKTMLLLATLSSSVTVCELKTHHFWLGINFIELWPLHGDPSNAKFTIYRWDHVLKKRPRRKWATFHCHVFTGRCMISYNQQKKMMRSGYTKIVIYSIVLQLYTISYAPTYLYPHHGRTWISSISTCLYTDVPYHLYIYIYISSISAPTESTRYIKWHNDMYLAELNSLKKKRTKKHRTIPMQRRHSMVKRAMIGWWDDSPGFPFQKTKTWSADPFNVSFYPL